MAAYDAVLFDQDGVLVDPPAREVQATATRDAFAALGVEEADPAAVDDVVDGVSAARLRDIAAAHDLDPETFWDAREDHDEQSQLAAFRRGDRGLYDDVATVTDLDLARGVVSNNHHSTVSFVLEYFGLEGAFETYYGRPRSIASLARKKPAPHYLECALRDLDAESGLYVGDSEGDVLAAYRAGIDSVLVRRDHCRDLTTDPAPTYEVDSLADLHPLVG